MDVLLLGPVAATDDSGRGVAVGGEQQLRLLAALAAEVGRVVPSERLHAILWPEEEPGGATSALYSYVSRLRRSLGRDVIVTSKVGYGLAAEHAATDVARFEQLTARARSLDPVGAIEVYDGALGLWRGPAYGTFAGEPWALAAARRCEELRLAAMSERVSVLLLLDRADEAVADTELLVELDPLRESFVQLRMTALHAAGRSAQAMQAAAAFRRRLVDQSGLDPSPSLTTLERRIADNDPRALERPPRSLRGYDLGELIAEGSCAAVYVATQGSLDRHVAIKIVHRDRADEPGFVRRFEAEARLVARLEHPSIVPLYDYWREPGAAYLVFRLLRGGTLGQRLRTAPLTVDEVDVLVERIGGALAAAHHAGVAHRDVSVDNVLYDEDGQPFLTDFGIATTDASADAIGGDVRSFAEVARQALGRGETLQAADRRVLESVLRRGVIGETASIDDLVVQWRAGRRTSNTERPCDAPAPATIPNPFKGLRPFTELDRDDFFGRSAAVEALDDTLDASPFTCVVGASGSGKSSIVLAGLVPRRRDRSELVATMTPGARPLTSLGDATRRVATEAQLAAAHEDPARLLAMLAGDTRMLLVIDQLEELWSSAPAGERRDFVAALVGALEAPRSGLRVVATLRADFYGEALAEPALSGLVHDGTFPVLAMNAAELVEAVTQPVHRVGMSLEPGLDARIVGDAIAQPGGLPLMQTALATLFDERAGSVLTNAAYDRLGGLAGAVAFAAEGTYVTLEPAGQVEVRHVFGALIAPRLDGPDVRRRARRSELVDVSDPVLDRLQLARLVTFDRDRTTGEPTVEVSHESIFLHWPRLRTWIDDDRHDLVERAMVRDAAAAWEGAGRDPSHLLRGARLVGAEAVDPGTLDPVQQQFVGESVRQQ
ncbi:MAG: BTAD domain-containing putative transcriptional regulator [Ilumatobacteraceae bacterium]